MTYQTEFKNEGIQISHKIHFKNALIEYLNNIRLQLPIQNPMPFFVHNNPLMNWEHLPFDVGLKEACLLYCSNDSQSERAIIRRLEDIVIPIISSYLDQSMSRWPRVKSKSLWDWYCDYIENTLNFKDPIFLNLKTKLSYFKRFDTHQILLDYLFGKFSDSKHWKSYLQNISFHFKGWSGIISVLEHRDDLFPLEKRKVSLVEWICILVSIDDALDNESFHQMKSFDDNQISIVNQKLQDLKKNEYSYYIHIKEKLETHLQSFLINKRVDSISKSVPSDKIVQIFFCIDDREESLRRSIEEINPRIETFGTVGFFGIDMKLKLHGQMLYQMHCPPVIQPRVYVDEVNSLTSIKSKSPSIRQFMSLINHTRFSLFEPLLSFVGPIIYFSTLLLRTISPVYYTKIKNKIKTLGQKKLNLTYQFRPDNSYSIEDKAKIVLDILKSSGLNNQFSELIIMMAHGSTTSNNPFQKSYGCGACSGSSGLPNAIIFSQFANCKFVREKLSSWGYFIPFNTTFMAAHHDTCSDQIEFSETERLNDSQTEKLKIIKEDLQRALSINSKNRNALFGLEINENPKVRSLDWSQIRPEFGHSRVALSFFGPRELCQSFNFDRRAFLISYDPEIDLNGNLLEFVIMNALPVCANINLDYLTSSAFGEYFGAGSKLPMNIAAGIGLMTGSKSDLKIGLAHQMVDKHEPLRLLSFVYCSKEHLENIITKSNRIKNLIQNNWIHLVRIEPKTLNLIEVSKEIKLVFSNARSI